MKNKKTARWNLRTYEDSDERVKYFAECLAKSKNELIEYAVNSFLLNPKNFAFCPTCKKPTIIPEEIPVYNDVTAVTCSEGHKHYFDFETNAWVK